MQELELGFPIGLYEEITDFINHTLIELEVGDGIVLYTDGIPEAYNMDKKQYGLDKLHEVISQNWHQSADEIKQAIIDDVKQFIGEQTIANPQAEETRLDDYILDFIKWIQEKLKVSRQKWQEPQVHVAGMNNNGDSTFFLQLNIAFFVDDIKLEDGKRGERVKSQIYEEIFRHFKNTYLDFQNT
ncbi:SpoIIE family protein phosphatase [Dolichospermum sp. ST_con]|nr:SpoIIE family protein phosphatase [Dolichospermum sp. ST_con]MDD1420411.1 SpoIIE family protein phosphatase [Dolichospermum sp. ST_sed1]MDD1423764.1 SpoIIE family protein phosphatase [Dolichospermum sp. ST_sed9]MDD1430982.1 SpoIIE family protein phosphatase [Dolichospermum sp. ST_sed6]MDD1434845.1 SpoIIE family protein phosphatase [Dolichospermum sp. ST_sed10]MDD1439604.1 SpoIIE family protein phosphatase [Dolichospermum sp. ST_sed3]MDD1447727.1 SpoIIE family protein phosphatase [Dolichosp